MASLKARALRLYVTSVEQKGQIYTFTMYAKAKVQPQKIPELIAIFNGTLAFRAYAENPSFIYEKKIRNRKEKPEDSLEVVKKVLNGLKALIE